MKLLLLAVSVIVVFTVDSRDFPGKPGDSDPIEYGPLSSADQDQIFPGEPVENTIADDSQIINEEPDEHTNAEPKPLGSTEVDHLILKEGESRIERGLRDSQCEANVICGILGGSCIANTTVCSGWLVSEGCKGTNCKCCIPGSLEIKMKNFGLELQSLKDDLTKSSLQQTMELKSMIANITNTNAGLKEQIQSFTDSKVNASSNFESQLNNLTQANFEVNRKLDYIEEYASNHGCLKGSWWFPQSEQCFKYLTTHVKWATAESTCTAQGLELAKPLDPVELRAYIVNKYTYTDWIWLGAEGDGSYAKWTRDGQQILSDSYLWYSSGNDMSTSKCLAMAAYGSNLKASYNAPYYMDSCTTKHTILCEYVRK